MKPHSETACGICQPWVGVSLTIVLVLGAILAHGRPGPEGRRPDFLKGDSIFYAATAESLLRDQDFNLENQCFPAGGWREFLAQAEVDYGSDYAWAHGGYLTLKQSPVLSLAVVPLYALLGQPGCLLFNGITLVLLLLGIAHLGGGGWPGYAAAWLGLWLTPLHYFAYDFSPDLFVTGLLLSTLYATNRGWLPLAGLAAGLTIATKVYTAAFLVPWGVWVCVRLWRGEDSPGKFLASVAAGVLGLAPVLITNQIQHGHPLQSGYERQLNLKSGTPAWADHSSRFGEPWWDGAQDLLLNPTVGLWWTAPAWCLGLAGLLLGLAIRRAPVPAVSWVGLGVVLATLLLLAPYDGRFGGSPLGNRLCFPALAAGLVAMGQFGQHWRSGRQELCEITRL